MLHDMAVHPLCALLSEAIYYELKYGANFSTSTHIRSTSRGLCMQE